MKKLPLVGFVSLVCAAQAGWKSADGKERNKIVPVE